MAIEHVTRSITFDSLVVDIAVDRYICDHCGARESFLDEGTDTPEGNGWRLVYPIGDGEDGCHCKRCSAK
jgi:hypothetical protein